MEELFDSKAFRLRYDEKTNACVFTLIEYGDRDDFRTPMMHAVQIIKKHDSKHLIIEDACENAGNISDVDLKWIKKIIIPKLKATSCEHIYFVVDEKYAGSDCDDLPYSLFKGKFKTDKVVSEKFALLMIEKGTEEDVSEEVSSMTKAQALEYMGLPENANDFAIDEKFWVLSKQIRGDNTPEGKKKIAELSAAYDIATGRRDERKEKEELRQKERKFLNKTAEEWRTYFSYTWYKYLIGLLLLVLLGNLIHTIVTRPGYDCGVLAIGHFENDSDYVEKFLTSRLGFKNPLVSTVDIVIPNDQGQSQQAYADQTVASLMLSNPNVLVFDEVTIPYYYSYLTDLTSLYSYLKDNLTDEQFALIHPVYLSEREAMEIMIEYENEYGSEYGMVDEDLSEYSAGSVMIGISVTDEDAVSALGFENLWPETDTSLVFAINSQTTDYTDAEMIIAQLLSSVL